MRNMMLGGRRALMALCVLPLLCGSAHALLPPLTDYRYNDGEREIELDGRQAASVTLELEGPLTLDVPATLAAAVGAGALQRELGTGP